MSEATRLTDSGNAIRLVEQFRNEIIYCAVMGKWFRFNGKWWVPDDDGFIVRCAKESISAMFEDIAHIEGKDRDTLIKHALYSESEKGIRAAIRLAECEVTVAPDSLDANGFVFPAQIHAGQPML